MKKQLQRRIEESDNTSCLRGKEFNEIVLGSNSREVPEQELQDKRESPGRAEEFGIREVKASKIVYFVEKCRENYEEEDWQGEEEIIKVVRKIEKEDRLERIAKSKRKFWAREILLQELWKKVKERGEMKKWATDLITMETEKVLKCRIILTNHIIGNCIEEVMKKERVKKSEDMMKKSRNKEA